MKVIKSFVVYIALAIITVLFTNITYHFGDINHVSQLPHIFSKLNTGYLENDIYLKYVKEINPRHYYSEVITLLVRMFPAENVFYVLTLISNYLILIITYLSIRLFNASRLWGILTAITLLFYKGANLGGAGAVVDSYLIPQLLAMPIVLYAFYKLVRGNFKHTLISMLIALAIQPSLALLFSVPIGMNLIMSPVIKNKRVKAIVFFFSLVIFTYLLFPNNTNNVLSSEHFFSILAYFRAPHHYIPSRFLLEDYSNFVILMILFFGSLLYLLNINKFKVTAKYFLYSSLISILLMVVGYIFVEIIPIKQILALQTFRIVSLLRWMSIVVISAAVFTFIMQRAKSTSTNLFGVLILIFLILNQFKGVDILSMPNISQVRDADKNALYEYVAKNTPYNAVFLSPPYFGDMRIIPRRAIVVDWKSFPFNEKDMASWYERMMDCYGGGDLEIIKDKYHQINDNRLNILKEKYDFDYAILYSDTETKLNIIYEDKVFRLVKM